MISLHAGSGPRTHLIDFASDSDLYTAGKYEKPTSNDRFRNRAARPVVV
jgi:hypothetical protein